LSLEHSDPSQASPFALTFESYPRAFDEAHPGFYRRKFQPENIGDLGLRAKSLTGHPADLLTR
jgi:hypothetical protein